MQTIITEPAQNISVEDELRDRISELEGLTGIFNFLSRCLEQEVDKEFLLSMRTDLAEALRESGVVFDEPFYTGPLDDLVESLAEEYTGLFVAPGCISPYASVFETGCMFKEPADKAINAYRAMGWDYQTRYSGEFPDHIGTMLGFYGILCAAESDSLENGDLAQADELKSFRDTFLVGQLGSWGPGWCHLAGKAANESFYTNVLKLAEQLLWSELRQVVDRRKLQELMTLNRREPKRMDYDADFRKASGL